MTNDTCVDCGRQRKRGQGSAKLKLCSTCYSRHWRANNKTTKPCEWCGTNFKTDRKETQYCGFSCAGKYQNSKLANSEAWQDYQTKVQANKKPAQEPKTQEELQALWRSKRSPMRAAYEDQQWGTFHQELKRRCKVTPGGCWEWQGQGNKSKKSSSPYPVVKWSGRGRQVHRLSLEAKHGAPLGSQHTHHTCANTMCVNPEHLEAATHVENIAEMKARRSYEARIQELEAALRDIDPEHHLLRHIKYG